MALAATVLLAGCAMPGAAPVAHIAALPVVRVGEVPPASGEYVVHYPAGQAFTARLRTRGSLFASPGQVETGAVLARDLYLYKHWASHDGRAWQPSHRLLEVRFTGGFDVEGLTAEVSLEAQ